MASTQSLPGPRYHINYSDSQRSEEGFLVICSKGQLLLNSSTGPHLSFLRRNLSDSIIPTLRFLLGLQFEGFLTEIKAGLTRALPVFILDLPLRSEFSDARDWLRQQYPITALAKSAYRHCRGSQGHGFLLCSWNWSRLSHHVKRRRIFKIWGGLFQRRSPQPAGIWELCGNTQNEFNPLRVVEELERAIETLEIHEWRSSQLSLICADEK